MLSQKNGDQMRQRSTNLSLRMILLCSRNSVARKTSPVGLNSINFYSTHSSLILHFRQHNIAVQPFAAQLLFLFIFGFFFFNSFFFSVFLFQRHHYLFNYSFSALLAVLNAILIRPTLCFHSYPRQTLYTTRTFIICQQKRNRKIISPEELK